MRWVKRIALGIVSLLLLVVAGLALLPWLIDPNDFKPQIQHLAAEQGVKLELNGPISWQFYPNLGLSISDIVVAPSSQPDIPIALLREGLASVALMPLFSKQIRVNQLRADGASITLIVDKNGRGNWQALGKNNSTPPPVIDGDKTDSGSAQNLDLSVDSIVINEASLHYEDQQTGNLSELKQLAVKLNKVNFDQQPIPLSIAFLFQDSSLPQSVQFDVSGNVVIDQTMSNFSFSDGELRATLSHSKNNPLSLSFSVDAALEPSLSYRGSLASNTFDAKQLFAALNRPLPEMADDNVMTKINFSGEFEGRDTGVDLSQFKARFDDTEFSGTFGFQFATATNNPKVRVQLKGTDIDVDRYLAPATDTPVTATPTSATPTDTALPMQTLTGIDVDVSANMKKIVVSKLPIENAELAINSTQGLWRISKLNADFYQGKLAGNGQLNARNATINTVIPIEFNAQLTNLAVQPLLNDVAGFSDLSGSVSGKLITTTKGKSTTQLFDNLSADFSFTSQQLSMQGFNAEQYYCEMAAQLDDEAAVNTTWPEQTDITNVVGQLIFKESQLNIAKLEAHIANLTLKGAGFANLKNQQYRVRLPLQLAQEKTSSAGCLITSNFLKNREVDIVGCQGSLEQLALGEQCGLDTSAVTDLAKQALRYNVQKKTDPKKQELRQDLKDKLNEKLGDDDKNKEILRNLLKF